MTDKIHQPPTYRTLDQMFSMQRLILAEYKIRESLPDWPWDIHERKNQKLLKEFVYRLMEELAEASENLQTAYDYISTNRSELAEDAIAQYNEEIADAWHFFLEIFIFTGIDENGIRQWIRQKKDENGIFDSTLDHNNLLKGFLNFAQFKNTDDGCFIRKKQNEFVIYPEPDVFTECPENMGARSLSQQSLDMHFQFFWAVSSQLMKAMNQLKIRDWHDTEKKTVNLIKFNEALMEAFIFFIRLMDYTRKTELSIYNSYVLKNQINWERFQTQ